MPVPWILRWSPSVGSTNDLALQAARRGEPAWTAWLADHQTQGRGRQVGAQRRAWTEAPSSSILMSVLLRPALRPEQAAALPLAVAVGCAESLREGTGLPVGLKWPNDLWLGGRKLGGILTEATFDQGSFVVVVGVGINVNLDLSALPAHLQGTATSLQAEAGRAFDRLSLVTALLERMEEVIAIYEEHAGLGPLAARWRVLSATHGRRVRLVGGGEGGEGEEGVALDIEDDGALCVELADGARRVVRAGEVEFIP
jgi:BirA family biotin operon repressor/biotin-[acetyl-CoA-carboxylase] ligase